jgi:hypothetical protein
MKTQLRFLWIIAVVIALSFTGCDSLENLGIGTEAALTGLSIGNVRIPVMPTAIDSFDFDDEEFDLVGADVISAPLERSSDTQNVRLNPNVSRGATVMWGIGSQDLRPFTFYDRRVNATFEDADYLYFKVTSEDGETTNYYRFAVWVRSPVTEISEVYVGRYETHTETTDTGNTITVVDVDERMMATIGTANPNLQTAISNANVGVLSIRENQAANAEIKVTRYDSNATLRYGITATSSAAPSFGTSSTFNLTDYTYLYIEVTAENTVDKAYYKFRVEVGRIASIKTLTFTVSPTTEFDVANTGTRAGTWSSVGVGKFETADMPTTGFGVKIELDDPASHADYEIIASKSAAEPASFSNPAKVLFTGTNVLAVKIVSSNTKATRYYKIEVGLLAAAFTKQPKSDYYKFYDGTTTVGNAGETINWYDYVGLTVTPFTSDSPQPLTFELDRAGTFTYQWYEANSWYGGYGFDADGRILYFPSGQSVAKPETGFKADDYHVNGFDEKKNVSLHNGGNQYYRLENPGRPITGASGTYNPSNPAAAAYTPPINRRPFLAGATNETHYYWVVITDDLGRKAVSKRAAIISERDPDKKHYIVNLNEDLYLGPKDNPTETGTARNQKVFKVKRETYKIPVTFPATFNMNDYTVATVQALFFLIDGTPWIQNWTQGDIGFEDEDEDRVMYYNLTNNNGTLGLVGGGKEPSGGTVSKTPKYLIVKPAGEKPVWELPPLNADGTPKPNNDAQGWFCGFIELVEVSFEGPHR